MALAEVCLAEFLSEAVIPCEEDAVTRRVIDTHDPGVFADRRTLTTWMASRFWVSAYTSAVDRMLSTRRYSPSTNMDRSTGFRKITYYTRTRTRPRGPK